jgi:pSer/pThr/pTyr-binding forkhead associated (FHA) protein
MEKKELIIGKQGDYVVNDNYVSRRHARLVREDDGLYIEDLDSTNGTYVNGKRVKRKKITASDVIVLGERYRLDLADAMKNLPMTDAEFTRSFVRLKQTYDDYSESQLDISTRVQSPMVSRLLGSVPGLLIAGSMMMPMESMSQMGAMRMYIMLGGVVISVIGGLVSDNIMTKKNRAKQKRLRELNEQFSIDYSCPNCQTGFGNRSWESLKRQGHCPACKRKFNVK